MALTTFIVASTAVNAYGSYKSGRDQREAAQKNAIYSAAEAEHRRKVAEYNAQIYREQAGRLRGEMVDRLNESADINIDRLDESRDINVGRLDETRDINVDRIEESRDISIDRIEEVVGTNVARLMRKAKQVRERGTEDENAIRRDTSEIMSAQRASYAAGNVMVDTGTPATMQIDTARMGEVDALRVRRNYRRQAQEVEEQAGDLQRNAEWAVGDINRVSTYRISDLNRTTDNQIDDINRTTGYQIDDIDRQLGYDLSDTEYEAKRYDQQAALTILQGEGQYDALINRSNAYGDMGSDAYTAGILNSAGNLMEGVAYGIDSGWFTPDSAANQA